MVNVLCGYVKGPIDNYKPSPQRSLKTQRYHVVPKLLNYWLSGLWPS